jgi:23S rRNA pseudouridine2605 synthase/16S rRNA pseudouridine516 synthase
MERLQKVLANAGVASRRHSEELIQAGKVKVNGEVVKTLGTKVDPEKDAIVVNGKLLKAEAPKIYLMLNKPAGYVTTAHDPQGRPTVLDLVKDVGHRVYPVGRLDFDTEGLLLLTNDGDLTYALTHPKHEVGKTYLALVQGVPGPDKLKRFQKGLRLADGKTAPARVRPVKNIRGNAWLEITIHEGRNRQVRRMCETIGHPVIKLKRIKLGFLDLDKLEEGKYRLLTKEEVRKLKQH